MTQCGTGGTPGVVPANWHCGPSAYGDEECSCECTAWDPDCNTGENHTVACRYKNGLAAAVSKWSCDTELFGTNDRCDCCSGVELSDTANVDPDCLTHPAPIYCAGGAITSSCKACPAGTWNASCSKPGGSTCQCGCGAWDPKCNTLECSASAHCFVDTLKCVPDAWNCSKALYRDGKCDSGCAVADPDCVTPAAKKDDDKDDHTTLIAAVVGGGGGGLLLLAVILIIACVACNRSGKNKKNKSLMRDVEMSGSSSRPTPAFSTGTPAVATAPKPVVAPPAAAVVAAAAVPSVPSQKKAWNPPLAVLSQWTAADEAFNPSAEDSSLAPVPEGWELNPPKLTFGVPEGENAPVSHVLSQQFRVRNTGRDAVSIRIFAPQNSKVATQFQPSSFIVQPGQETTVSASMVLHFTPRQIEPIAFLASRGGRKHHVLVPVAVDARNTARIDYSELDVSRDVAGEGPVGTVHRAKWRGNDVSVKHLRVPAIENSREEFEDFLRDLALRETLRTPMLVAFHGACVAPGHLAYVTEWCEYMSVAQLMQTHEMSFALRLRVAADAAKAMNHLHQANILHRNLKLANLLVVSSNPEGQLVCKLTDLTSSHAIVLQTVGCLMKDDHGSAAYLAPELYKGESYSKATDVYSFSIILWELLTQRVPYEGMRSPKIKDFVTTEAKRLEIPATSPPEYARLVKDAWGPNPISRPQFDVMLELL
eukprot:m51a1_g12865 putative protein serine threonine (707) ;mRNA; f:474-3016